MAAEVGGGLDKVAHLAVVGDAGCDGVEVFLHGGWEDFIVDW